MTDQAAANQAPAETVRDATKPDPFYGYGSLSVLLHWATVLIIIAMVVSAGSLHLSLGLVFMALLVWRVVRRWGNGFPRVSDQPLALNFIERLAIITALIALLVLAATGLLMPLMEATPYSLFGLASWQPPLDANSTGSLIVRTTHAYSAWALYGAIAVHLLAAAKHITTIKDGVLLRIVKPVIGGK